MQVIGNTIQCMQFFKAGCLKANRMKTDRGRSERKQKYPRISECMEMAAALENEEQIESDRRSSSKHKISTESGQNASIPHIL